MVEIDSIRKSKGITQKELVDQIGVSVKTYNNWVKERNPIPSDKLIAISKILSTSIDEMLGINTKN